MMEARRYHFIVDVRDRARIKCSHCGAPAHICRYRRLKVGAGTSPAFYYYCADCDPEKGKYE